MAPVRDGVDELVQSVSYYNPRPLVLHGYIGPFISIYALLIYSWMTKYSLTDSHDIWFLYVGIAVVFQILAFLFCLWSVHVHCFLAYNKVRLVQLYLFTDNQIGVHRWNIQRRLYLLKLFQHLIMAQVNWFGFTIHQQQSTIKNRYGSCFKRQNIHSTSSQSSFMSLNFLLTTPSRSIKNGKDTERIMKYQVLNENSERIEWTWRFPLQQNCSKNEPLHRFSFSKYSVSVFGALKNFGTTVYSRYSCWSVSNGSWFNSNWGTCRRSEKWATNRITSRFTEIVNGVQY